MQKELHLGNQVECDNNVVTGYLDIYYMAAMIRICFEKEVKNRLFQVSSKDIVSAYDFAMAYAEIFHQDKSMITKGKWRYPLIKGMGASSTQDKFYLQMDISNLEGFLSIKLPSVKESLAFTFKRLHGSFDKEGSKETKGDEIKFI